MTNFVNFPYKNSKSRYLETDVMPRGFKSVIIILFYSLHSPSLGSFLASVSAANIKIE